MAAPTTVDTNSSLPVGLPTASEPFTIREETLIRRKFDRHLIPVYACVGWFRWKARV